MKRVLGQRWANARCIAGIWMTWRQYVILAWMEECWLDGFVWLSVEGNANTTRERQHLRETFQALTAKRFVTCESEEGHSRYAINWRGRKALDDFSKQHKRYDKVCPRCNLRPRRVMPGGRLDGYCRECKTEYYKDLWRQGRIGRARRDRTAEQPGESF